MKDRGAVVQPSCSGHLGKAHDGRDCVACERGKRASELIAARVNRKFTGIRGIVCQAPQNRLGATEDDYAVRFTPFHSRAYQVDGPERAGTKQGRLVGGDLHARASGTGS